MFVRSGGPSSACPNDFRAKVKRLVGVLLLGGLALFYTSALGDFFQNTVMEFEVFHQLAAAGDVAPLFNKYIQGVVADAATDAASAWAAAVAVDNGGAITGLGQLTVFAAHGRRIGWAEQGEADKYRGDQCSGLHV